MDIIEAIHGTIGQTVAALISLIYMAFLVGVFVAKMRTTPEKRWQFINGFKEGEFVFIYFAVIPLYFVGFFDGTLHGVLSIFEGMLNLVGLSYNEAFNAFITTESTLLFSLAAYLCYLLSFANTVLFATSLVGRVIANYFRALGVKMKAKKQTTYVIFGESKKNYKLLRSLKKSDGGVWFCRKDDDLRMYAHLAKRPWVRLQKKEDPGKALQQFFGSFQGKKMRIIINEQDEERALWILRSIVTFMTEPHQWDPDKRQIEALRKEMLKNGHVLDTSAIGTLAYCDEHPGLAYYPHIDVLFYDYGMPSSVTKSFIEACKGKLHRVSLEDSMAERLAWEFPLTAYMTEDHIDYDSADVGDGVDAGYWFIGYNSLTKELIRSAFRTNCIPPDFVYEDGKLVHLDNANGEQQERTNFDLLATKQRKIHIKAFDGALKFGASEYDRTHFPYRYWSEWLPAHGKEDGYYPLPEETATFSYVAANPALDNFLPVFLDEYKKDFTRLSVRYIVVNVGDDVENIAFAQKLKSELRGALLQNDACKILPVIRDDKMAEVLEVQQNIAVDYFLKQKAAKEQAGQSVAQTLLDICAERSVIAFTVAENLYKVHELTRTELDKIAWQKNHYYEGLKMAAAEENYRKICEDEKRLATAQMDDVERKEEELRLAGKKQEALQAIAKLDNARRGTDRNRTAVQRDSNFYAASAYRFKLHLLGLDYAPQDDERKDATALFYQRYFGMTEEQATSDEAEPIVKAAIAEMKGKKAEREYVKDTARTRLAYQEHERWNAYMLSESTVPTKVGEGKDIMGGKHPNLTTMAGLNMCMTVTEQEIQKNEQAKQPKTLTQLRQSKDVVCYDYSLMDSAAIFLKEAGFKIVER